MKLNRSNYEAFFLDYHEGNLSSVQKEELFVFLDANSDLKEEFEGYEEVRVESSGKSFADKDVLKREIITHHNCETYFIAYHEGDLSADERKTIEHFVLSNPGLKGAFEIYRHTKLFFDTSVVFADKASLKRGGRIVAFGASGLRIAAAACIALLLLFVYQWNRKPVSHEVAVTSAQKTKATAPVDVPRQRPVAAANSIVKETTEKNLTAEVKDLPKQKREMKTTPAVHVETQQANVSAAVPEKSAHPENGTAEVQFVINENQKPDTAVPDSLKKKYAAFTDEELADLKVKADKQESSPTLLNKAAGGLSSLLGERVSAGRSDNAENANSTFAFAVGSFEFRRTVSK